MEHESFNLNTSSDIVLSCNAFSSSTERRAPDASFVSRDSSESLSSPISPATPIESFESHAVTESYQYGRSGTQELVTGAIQNVQFEFDGSFHPFLPSNSDPEQYGMRALSTKSYSSEPTYVFNDQSSSHGLPLRDSSENVFRSADFGAQMVNALVTDALPNPAIEWTRHASSIETTISPTEMVSLSDIVASQADLLGIEDASLWQDAPALHYPFHHEQFRVSSELCTPPQSPTLSSCSLDPDALIKQRRTKQRNLTRIRAPRNTDSSEYIKPKKVVKIRCSLKTKDGKDCPRIFQRPEHYTRHTKAGMHKTTEPRTFCDMPRCHKSAEKHAEDPIKYKGFVGDRQDNVKEHIINTHLIDAEHNRRNYRIKTYAEALKYGWGTLWDEAKRRTHKRQVLRMWKQGIDSGNILVAMETVYEYFVKKDVRMTESQLEKVFGSDHDEFVQAIVQRQGHAISKQPSSLVKYAKGRGRAGRSQARF